jgi:hypothetical protein
MFVIVELLCGTQRKKERKRYNISNIINTAFVKVEDIRICIKSCQKGRGGR